MCLIIHKPAGKTVPLSLMLEAFDNNEDGLGWMLQGEVDKIAHVKRKHVRDLTGRLNKRWRDYAVAVHFRWRTHGLIDRDNTHPYPLANGGWLMHNGVLPCGSFYDPNMSDTWHYIAFDLHNAPADLQSTRWDDVEREIGTSNKFAVMAPDGSMRVLNRKAGRKYQGLWLSNTYSTPSLFRSAQSYTQYGTGYGQPLKSGGRVQYDPGTGKTFYWAPEAPARPGSTAPVTQASMSTMQQKALDALFRRQYGNAYAGTVTNVRTGEAIAVDADGTAIVPAHNVETDYPGLVALARGEEPPTDASLLEEYERAFPLNGKGGL